MRELADVERADFICIVETVCLDSLMVLGESPSRPDAWRRMASKNCSDVPGMVIAARPKESDMRVSRSGVDAEAGVNAETGPREIAGKVCGKVSRVKDSSQIGLMQKLLLRQSFNVVLRSNVFSVAVALEVVQKTARRFAGWLCLAWPVFP
jgi:hypothetical protein